MKRSDKYVSEWILEQQREIEAIEKWAWKKYQKSKKTRKDTELYVSAVKEAYSNFGTTREAFLRMKNRSFFYWAGYQARLRADLDRWEVEKKKIRRA